MNMNATLIGQGIAFAIFVLFCMKYVWPPIVEAMRARQNKIAEGLDAANRATHDLELAQERAKEHIKEAKDQALVIIEKAKKTAVQIVDDAKDQAKKEGDRLISQAESQIEQEINSAKDKLKVQLGSLVVEGAEKILTASVDAKAQQKLINQLTSEL